MNVQPLEAPSLPSPGHPSLEDVREEVRRNLLRASRDLTSSGLAAPRLDGKLLRPLAAYLVTPESRRRELGDRFWYGALALEMVHEASLLHDDILDEAPERRGKPTMVSRMGIGPTLVLGDHLLTSAYRAAALSQSPEYLSVFVRAVERTVAGEIAQERSQGEVLEEEEYLRIVTGKSGELFRAALSLSPTLLDLGSPIQAGDLGARIGCLYQMVDDFLDYCPHASRGKRPLQDYRQGKWTWPLGLIPPFPFGRSEAEPVARLFRTDPSTGVAPMETGARRIRREANTLLLDGRTMGLETSGLEVILYGWVRLVETSTQREMDLERGAPDTISRDSSSSVRSSLRKAAAGIATPTDRLKYFGRHSRSFRFAARGFPPDFLEKVAGVYAFCRFTDDLVDEPGGLAPHQVRLRLREWGRMAREAYDGVPTGTPILHEVMGTLRDRDISFHYVKELIQGVEMDLEPRAFGTLEDVRRYAYRVASVVGEWLTELAGVTDAWVLEKARALGQAMQLTNILRDVGEDLKRGRVYLPEDRMAAHGFDRSILEEMAAGTTPPPPAYRDLMEELMEVAEQEYELALQGIPALPPFFRSPVAMAASVYRGIHGEIRKNGYDNLRRRAKTSLFTKMFLAGQALRKLRRDTTSPAPMRPSRGWFLLPILLLGFSQVQAQAQSGTQSSEPPSISNVQPPDREALRQWAEPYLDSLDATSPFPDLSGSTILEKIRALYFLSVEDKHRAEELAGSLANAQKLHVDTPDWNPILDAYRGALEIARAKHARWPPNKLNHLNRGSEILDSLVTLRPGDAEIRFLRLASYRFLPFFLSRGEAVADDARALASALETRPAGLSRAMYRIMIQFVLAYAPLELEDKVRLARALEN